MFLRHCTSKYKNLNLFVHGKSAKNLMCINSPKHSSILTQYGLTPLLWTASCCPILKIFSRPFSATWMIFESITVSSSHSGGIQPWSARYRIWTGVPPLVALVIAQAASFRVLNSDFPKISIRSGKIFASITAWKEQKKFAKKLYLLQF